LCFPLIVPGNPKPSDALHGSHSHVTLVTETGDYNSCVVLSNTLVPEFFAFPIWEKD